MRASCLALARSLRELCFPAVCLLCRQGLPAFSPIHLCPGCLPKIKLIGSPICRCCGVELMGGDDHLCGPCLKHPPFFRRARAVFRYDDDSAPLLYAFKFYGKTVGCATFCALAKQVAPLADLAVADLIVPVPLHPRRLRARGFNQALVLARILFSNEVAKISTNLLVRSRWTDPQTTLTGRERRRNLNQAFTAPHPERLVGRRLLLIDDVFTTGSTVNECAKVLIENGAASVEVLTLARVR